MPDPANAATPAAPPDPTAIFALSVAYWRSAALFTGLDLNLFATLGDAALPIPELAERLGCPLRSTRMLAEALVAVDLLAPAPGDAVRLTRDARAFLVPGTPAYLGDAICFNARSYAAWGALTRAVREAAPTMSPQHFLGDDPAATRNFVLAMHGRAMGVARCLVTLLDLSGRRRLLDVAGGPATYSVLLAERYPDLHCTVMDLPGVAAVARDLIAASPAAARVTLQPGDIFVDDFGSGYDAVLVSGVAHRTEGAATVALLRKAADALAPGGLLALSDLFTGGPAQGPVLPELFSLHMLVTADSGRSLPMAEMADAFRAAGLTLTATLPYPAPLPHTLLLGVKS